jgi:hypothetical protein
VNTDLKTYLELLDRHLSLLRLLAQEFVACRKEFMALDVDGIYRRIYEQEELCRQIERLQAAILSLQQKCVSQFGLGSQEAASNPERLEYAKRVAGTLHEIERAREEVGRLNRIHAAYLRRSRKTADVLLNFVGKYAMTYARPGQPAAGMPAAEKG